MDPVTRWQEHNVAVRQLWSVELNQSELSHSTDPKRSNGSWAGGRVQLLDKGRWFIAPMTAGNAIGGVMIIENQDLGFAGYPSSSLPPCCSSY